MHDYVSEIRGLGHSEKSSKDTSVATIEESNIIALIDKIAD